VVSFLDYSDDTRRPADFGDQHIFHPGQSPQTLPDRLGLVGKTNDMHIRPGVHRVDGGQSAGAPTSHFMENPNGCRLPVHQRRIGCHHDRVHHIRIEFDDVCQRLKITLQDCIAANIEAARRTRLPLIIHARDADADIARILTEEYRAGAYSCVMHCFSSSAALARAALDLGFYLSMSGIATFPKSGAVREIFASAPLDRILLETDSPYLAPPPHRGRRGEPAFTALTAATGAALFGLPLAEFAAATCANFDRLFWKAA